MVRSTNGLLVHLFRKTNFCFVFVSFLLLIHIPYNLYGFLAWRDKNLMPSVFYEIIRSALKSVLLDKKDEFVDFVKKIF